MTRITSSQDAWMDYLNTTAWLHKYPFCDQLLIYAQRVDARACAPMPLWNNTFKRWVNKGAKGIALIDDSGERSRLRYVFDVSDTNTLSNIPVQLWEAKPEHAQTICEELQNHFGETGLPQTIMGIAFNAVSDNHQDYLDALLTVSEDSALESLSADDIATVLRRL
jgi:hypothetical protein